MSNQDPVHHATDALQAQERLLWSLESNPSLCAEAKTQTYACLEALSSQKAYLEGSNSEFQNPYINEESMTDLKLLTLMHVPSSITPDVQKKFYAMVQQLLIDQCTSIISITLLTCPWFELSQKERGEQAKHNILLVIFLSHDNQFFAPVNSHIIEKASIIDFGWFCAVEVSHFGQALCRGRSRYLEALYCREGAEIYASQHWQDLRLSLSYQTLTGTRGFLEACLGQAVGAVGKKSKDSAMKLRGHTTITAICESFRLLQHVENTFKSSHLEIKEENLPSAASTIMIKLKSYYHHPETLVCKQELFDLLITWVKDLRLAYSASSPASFKENQAKAEHVIGEWMMKTRLTGRILRPCSAVIDSITRLQELMRTIGGHVSSLKPEQILLVAVAGSAMYNLSTDSSDEDYLVIYSIPSETLMSATKKLPETFESRGLDKSVEYGAYEARTFCEMLLKCSVVILELLFVEEHAYMSPLWKELVSHKRKFVTEKAISQYLGLIKNNLKSIGRGKHSQSPKKERKLFYQNFHKIHCVQHMLRGEVPPVRVSGDIREFIMNVRTQNQGKWSHENVLEELNTRYRDLRESLVVRTHRLKENPDYELCAKWLMSVRGL